MHQPLQNSLIFLFEFFYKIITYDVLKFDTNNYYFEKNQIDNCIKFWKKYTEVTSNNKKRENIIKIIDILKNKK